jgi:hypothetical protein
MVDQIPKLINEKDGSVTRFGICGCGRSLYKKNLTTGEIYFSCRIIKGQIEQHRIEPMNNPSLSEITCPSCEAKHLVGDIREMIFKSDLVAATV